MLLRINNEDLPAYPADFTVTILDLDNADTSVRTADGNLHRDRITVKRQIEMTFNALPQEQIAAILQAVGNTFFEFTYPDPMDGGQATRTFYVGNRPAPMAVERNGVIWWSGLKLTLTER